MESQPIIQDRKIRMIQFNQMLECPIRFLGGGFDVVNLDWWNADRFCRRRAGVEEGE
jgi:hypothetical protein